MTITETLPAKPVASPTQAAPKRLISVDAFRGFVMFLMMAEVLRLGHLGENLSDQAVWRFLGYHQSHVEWIGCSLHDLIQPSFSFLVGVALPFSIAARVGRGQTRWFMHLHAAWRALLLILLGVFLRSIDRSQTYWTFEDTLTQIGLGYFFLYLLGWRSVRVQWAAFALLLIGYWSAFALYPLPGPDFNYPRVGVEANWPHLMSGFAAHWNKNSNLAWAFDTWFLNLFPREQVFIANSGGYATLSFIPMLSTMILGLIAGGVLRRDWDDWKKLKWLAAFGLASLGFGYVLGAVGICPVVKRIWTPSWTLYSGGWCLLLLAGFYCAIEVCQSKRWVFPLVVVGMNSIAAYLIAHLFEDFYASTLRTHLGMEVFELFGKAYGRLVLGGAILALYWLTLWWMYRRKLFLKI